MEYTIKFSQQEVQVICMALGELPMKVSLNLFSKIQQEVTKQDHENALPLSDIEALS